MNLNVSFLIKQPDYNSKEEDQENHEMRPLVEKNQSQNQPMLIPRRPQIIIGDHDKQMAPPDTGAIGNGAGATGNNTGAPEVKSNEADVIHCNFVLKRTNDPIEQI